MCKNVEDKAMTSKTILKQYFGYDFFRASCIIMVKNYYEQEQSM